jgi:hypothetical protein
MVLVQHVTHLSTLLASLEARLTGSEQSLLQSKQLLLTHPVGLGLRPRSLLRRVSEPD